MRIDLTRIDLVGVDFVRVDLVGAPRIIIRAYAEYAPRQGLSLHSKYSS